MTDVMAPALVRRAHDDAVAYVGAAVRHREEREAELAAIAIGNGHIAREAIPWPEVA